MSVSAAAMVGEVILGEYSLLRLAWQDEVLAAFEAQSASDGGLYTVLVATELELSASPLGVQRAVEQAGRRAMGLRTIRPLWKATTLSIEGHPRLLVVRRGEVGGTLRELVMERPRSLSEALALLEPIAGALASLHDQGAVHGAVSPALVSRGAEGLLLDGYGLSDVAEAAHGSGGTSQVIPTAYLPPELRGGLPSAPGMWSDAFGLGALLIDLLTGRSGVVATLGETPSVAPLGLGLPASAAQLIDKLVSPSMIERSVELRACFAALQRAASEPEAPVAEQPAASSPSWQAMRGPASPAAEESPPPQIEPAVRAPLPLLASQRESPAAEQADDTQTRKLILLGGVALLVVMAGALGVMGFFMTRQVKVVSSSPSASASASTSPAAPGAEGEEAEGEAEVVPSLPATPSEEQPSDVHISATPTYPEDAQALVPILPGDAVWGDRDALLTLVLFGDLTCPYTARTLGQLPAIAARYRDEVRFVFKQMPIAERSNARAAAEGAALVIAKGKPGAFWDFADDVFSARSRLNMAQFEQFGVAAGLTAGEMTTALTSRSMKARVEQDVSLGLQLGVRGTPVVFFNGLVVSGLQPIEQLFVRFDAELRVTRAALGSASKPVTRAGLYASRVLANITTTEGDRAPGSDRGP